MRRLLALAGLLMLALVPPTPCQEKLELSKDERELIDLTNAERRKEGLPVLKPNSTLMKVAREHAANMAKQEKMAHNLDGKTPFQRIKAAGYMYMYAGENVAEGNVAVARIVEGWMESGPHRKNILSPNFTEIGMARAFSEKSKSWYYAQVFGKPRGK